MKRETSLSSIEKRISSKPFGSIFITSDFTDIASADTANRALQRLEETGVIRRVLRGVYERPEFSEFLQETIAPSPNKVAQAIARNYGWTIVPSGDTALNMLGLSTQVPAVWSYVSDGPYKEYQIDHTRLKFKHTAKRELALTSFKTALVIQALKALGKPRITDGVIQKIASLMTSDEKREMLKEAQHTTSWIYEVLKDIGHR